jgi:uncharacterized protein (TIGR02466 family)
MNYTVTDIFPTPIYQSMIDPRILSTYEKELDSLCEKYTLSRDTHDNDHELDNERRHILDKFPELKEHLQTHLNTFTRNIIGEPDKFKLNITTSWCVGISPGKGQVAHHHENSIVSGVFYFMNEDTASDIVFIRDISVAYNNQLNLNPTIGSKYSFRESRAKPKNGQLILFPAHIKHKVMQHNGTRRRNCVAFDSFVSGNIGDRRTILTL